MLFKKIPMSILCTTTSEVKRYHRVRLTLAPKSIHSLNERCYLRNAVSSFLLGRTSDTVGGHVNSTRVSAVRRDAQTAAKRLGVHAVRRDTRALELQDVGRGSHCHRRHGGTSDPSGASTHGCASCAASSEASLCLSCAARSCAARRSSISRCSHFGW